MSAQLNYVFLPTDLPGLTFKSIKRPVFNTEAPEASSGDERRTALRSRVSWFWQLDYEFIYKAPPGPNEMFSFFASMQGAGLAFLYRDPSDTLMTVTQGTFISNVSDGTTTTKYQIARILSPTYPFVEIVTNGLWNTTFGADTFQIYDNGSPYFTGLSAAPFFPTGEVQFNVHTPPAAGHKANMGG